MKQNVNDDELFVVLDSDDSSGSETSIVDDSAYATERPMQKVVSKRSSAYESHLNSSDKRSFSNKSAAVEQASSDRQNFPPLPSKEVLMPPVKTVDRAKRTKIWEKACIYEKKLTAQPQPLLSSPRRRDLPEALKPALDLFEGRSSNKRKGKRTQYEDGALVELDNDDDDSDLDYNRVRYRRPLGNLKATLEKFEKLSQLAKEKNDLENQIQALGRKAKRRKSAGNGTISGKTVVEKMRQIDELFKLHHKVKGTDLASLAIMQENVKEAHREDFEKQIRVNVKQNVLGRYQERLVMELLKKEQRKKNGVANDVGYPSLSNVKKFQDMFTQAKQPSGKMKRRDTIGRYKNVAKDLFDEYTKADNEILQKLLREYQSHNLGLQYNGQTIGNQVAAAAYDNAGNARRSVPTARNVSGLRPGMQRGASFSNDFPDGAIMPGVEYSSADEDEEMVPKRRTRHVPGLRPGMQRGASFSNDFPDGALMSNDAYSSAEESEELAPRRRNGGVRGLRPGLERGLSFERSFDARTDTQEAFDCSSDEDKETAPRRRPRSGTGLRPGVQRGMSFDKDSQVAAAMQEAVGEKEEFAPRRRPRGGTGLRPGLQRGMSFDKDSQVAAAMQEAVDDNTEESDEVAPRRRPRGGTGLRPGLQRGMSFDKDSQVAAAMQDAVCGNSDEDEETAPRIRSRGGTGPRPGVQRGMSFDKDSQVAAAMQDAVCGNSDEDEETAPRRRPRGGTGLRPALQRGMSFDRDYQISDSMQQAASSNIDESEKLAPRSDMQRQASFHKDSEAAAAMPEDAYTSTDEEEEFVPRRRTRGNAGLRPGVQRGMSFDKDSHVGITMQQAVYSSSSESDEVVVDTGTGSPDISESSDEAILLPTQNDYSFPSGYSVYCDSDSDDDDGCRMKKVDRLLAKATKYLGKGSSAAHTGSVKKKRGSKKIREDHHARTRIV